MTDDIKELDNLVKEKKIFDVDTMIEESKKLTEKIPDFKERYEKVIRARGYILDLSIVLEVAFNELITKTGGEDLVMNHEKRELHLISGIKKENELGSLGFKDKTRIVKAIMKKLDDEHPKENSELENTQPTLLDDLEKIVSIRNIFAHVPISWFSKELEFDDNSRYKHYFKLNPKWKIVSIAINEFMVLQREILEFIPAYIKIVLLRREIFSKILLGKSYNEILEDARKLNEKEKDKKV